MRHDVAELDRFPQEGAIDISVDLIRRLSPDSLSVMEFKNAMDVTIAEKMLKFPLLGEEILRSGICVFTAEFHMTNDSHLFQDRTRQGADCRLYEGKMIQQFDHRILEPRYWIEEKDGRADALGRRQDTGQVLRLSGLSTWFTRDCANTDERTMISTHASARTFHGNKFPNVRSTVTDATR